VLSVSAVLTAERPSAPAKAPAPAAAGRTQPAKPWYPACEPSWRWPAARARRESTTAVNLALGLKALDLRVGLLDADI